MPAADTAARSLTHWSEEGRAGMEAFYVLARKDYRVLAEALDWGRLLRAHARPGGSLRLLDVACGSGKFPEALRAYAALPGDLRVDYELLDPSAFSIAEARSVLAPPFHPGAEHECTLQALAPGAGPYDVVWATHALYALPPAELAEGVAAFLCALAPGGVGMIAHASHDAHYLRFYRDFLDDFRGGAGTPYTSSEQILAELRRAGAETQTLRLDYEGVVRSGDRATLEGYLQRCAFDDSVSLEEMARGRALGPYLARCEDRGAAEYRFEQHVDLILIGSGDPIASLRRA
jgi:SAM-dependent methyltransferase